ncbi:MAG: hypothetical protein HKM22_01975 [Gammaproteobacteria bacterium]|nr:hypothetical protein [Gammaproteobacteria bacterium]
MKNLFTAMLFALLGLALAGCGESADEKNIHSNMQAMRVAIQNHDKDGFMKHVAPGYRGQYHGSRPVLERFVIQQLSYNKKIYIYMADTSIEIKEGTARVIFYAGTAGGPDQVPERGQLYKVQTSWKQLSGHWQLTNARWRPALTR